MGKRIKDLPGQTDLLSYIEPAHQGRIEELRAENEQMRHILARWVEWVGADPVSPQSQLWGLLLCSKAFTQGGAE